MERQKIWICIGIAFLLLFAVCAAVLFSASEEQIDRSARFISLPVKRGELKTDILTKPYPKDVSPI